MKIRILKMLLLVWVYGTVLCIGAGQLRYVGLLDSECTTCLCDLDQEKDSDDPFSGKSCCKEDKTSAQLFGFIPQHEAQSASQKRAPIPEVPAHFQSDNHPSVATPPPELV